MATEIIDYSEEFGPSDERQVMEYITPALSIIFPEDDPTFILEWALKNPEKFFTVLDRDTRPEAQLLRDVFNQAPATQVPTMEVPDYSQEFAPAEVVPARDWWDVAQQNIASNMSREEFGKWLNNQMESQDYTEFATRLREIGRTPEVENMLRGIGATDEDINVVFGAPKAKEAFPAAAERQAILHEELGYNPAPPPKSKEEMKQRSEAFRAYRRMGGKLKAKQWENYGMPPTPADELPMLSPAERQALMTRETQKQKNLYVVFGKSLKYIPKQFAASVLQATQGQGGASVVDRDWADRFIKDAGKDLDKFAEEINEKYEQTDFPLNIEDIATLPQNIAYSLTSMGAGLAVGIPTALAPVPGARVAAWGLGSAASGAVAYNMTTYQIMQQYLEAKNEEMIAQTGRVLTAQEEQVLKDGFESKARNYGLWEAVPEAVSNLAFAKLLTSPLTRIVGKNIAARIVGKLVGLYGEELLTETITQKGQSAIEVEAGLREGNISWVEAFKEIAPQTFLLTTLMGGAGQIGVSSVSKIKQSLKKEAGGSPIFNDINQHIDESIFDETEAEAGRKAGEVTPEAKPTEVTKPVTPVKGEVIVEPSGYLYHSTPQKNLENIRLRGLESQTRQRNDWEEGDRTPQEQELLYFERKPNENWGSKQAVQLRINEDMLPQGVDITEDALRSGEFYTSHGKNEPYEIPPEAIEYLDTKTGKWIPLSTQVPTPTTQAPAVKEPWDMTRGEFLKAAIANELPVTPVPITAKNAENWRQYFIRQHELSPTEATAKTVPVEDIVKKVTQAIKEAKPARAETEQLKHEELSKRAAMFASILQGGEGAKAFERAKGALKGQLPQADFILDLEKFGITDADMTTMFEKIRLSNLKTFQKLNTYEALNKLLCGQIPTEGDLVLLERMFGSELIKAIQSQYTTGQKVRKVISDVINVPRTLQTIADLSATLRQGILLSVGQPIQFSHAFQAQIKSVFSEKNFKVIDEIIHNNVYADKAEEHKLYIAPIGEAVSVSAREEAYMGRIIERVPILGSIVRVSQRAYITMLNVLRMETWAYWCRQWEGTGKSWKDYDKLADFINHATGRGDLGKFSQAATILNATFYSPRFIASRIQVPLDLITTTPAVRKVIARNLVSFVATGMSVLGLAVLAGAEVEDDPRSSDFGKIKIGNKRFDFWGSYLPYVRFVTQVILEQRKSTATGAVQKVEWTDIALNFARSKLAPIPGLIWDLKTGKTFIGEELSAENADKIIFEKLTPIFLQDMVDAVKDAGVLGIVTSLPSILGVNVQTYADNWNTEESKLGLPEREEQLPFTVKIDIYDTKDYYSKVGQYIGSATADMLAEKKNVPPKVQAVAEARDIKKVISDIPNEKLASINADASKGDTFEQYHAQWQERQKITDEQELKDFDDKYPQAHLGNFTQNQYVLLKQYHNIEDKAEKEQFLKDHESEIGINPHYEWFKSHPEDNAKLAIWGQVDVLTQKAYDIAQKLIKELDIPDAAVRDYLPPKEVAEPYFEYKETVEKTSGNSWEVQLIKAENPDLVKWHNQSHPDTAWEEVETPIASLELKTIPEYHELYRKLQDTEYLDTLNNTEKDYDGLTERDRYIRDLKATKVGKETWIDIDRRVEAIERGTEDKPISDEIVNKHVEFGKIEDKFGGTSAEAVVYRADNLDYDTFRVDKNLWEKPLEALSEKNIDALRITAQFRPQDKTYDAIDPEAKNPETGLYLREEYLVKDEKYRIARRQREFYQFDMDKTVLPPGQYEALRDKYVNFYEMPSTGYLREHYIVDNLDLQQLLIDQGKLKEAINLADIPDKRYDEIYTEFKEPFDKWDSYADPESPLYIDNAVDRKTARKELTDSTEGFQQAIWERDAYKMLLPDELVKTYVAYKKLPVGPYETDWFLMEHKDFYDKVYIGVLKNDRRDYRKVPSRKVYAEYLQYKDLLTDRDRQAFRLENPDFESWGELVFGWKPVEELKEMTASDKLADEVAKRIERIRKLPRAQ